MREVALLKPLGIVAIERVLETAGLPLEEGERGLLREYILHRLAEAITQQRSLVFDRMTLRKWLDLVRKGER